MGSRKGTGERTSELQTVCNVLLGYRSQSGDLALGHMPWNASIGEHPDHLILRDTDVMTAEASRQDAGLTPHTRPMAMVRGSG